ncbi:MAG: radical SAM family heme chaperone HemW [Chloroflexota bacterium]
MKTESQRGSRPLGLYVHIPFCVRKCAYCDFLSAATPVATQRRYVAALHREIELMAGRPEISGRHFATLYVGGGTPTVLPPADLADIIDACLRRFRFSRAGSDVDALEVTVEANPGTVTVDGLARLRAAGANRLSLGVQSFDRTLLAELGRIHSAADACAAVAAARAAGFANINLDLMFALPGQTLAQWTGTLDLAIALEPEHISAYSLIVEEGTPFYDRDRRGELARPDEETEAAMYEAAIARLTAAGYHHYEISNFARPGREARHNLIYWHNDDYLGLGLGAWSYLPRDAAGGRVRDANPRDLTAYCESLERGRLPARVDGEMPARRHELTETIIMGLRLIDGLDLEAFCERFNIALDDAYPGVRRDLEALGLVEVVDNRLRLTRRGLLLANRVFAAFV